MQNDLACKGFILILLFFLKMLTAFYYFLLHIYLKNEFNFWNVHGIMNTLGVLQSNKGLHVNFISIHYSMNRPKNEFIAYIYILL